MLKTDMERKDFISFISSPNCEQQLIKSTEFLRYIINKDLPMLKKDKAIKQVLYAKWLLNISKQNYYLNQHGPDAISLFDISLGSKMAIRYCNTITYEARNIFKDLYKNAIEILSLHSIKKGEGKRLINEAITLSKDINLPLVLYTEIDDLVGYYEQFNFINYGKFGNNNEYMMVKFPKNMNKN